MRGPFAESAFEGVVRYAGRTALRGILAVGQITCLLTDALRALVSMAPRRRVLAVQLYRIGFLSLPVVILTGMSTGLVLAVQVQYTLDVFNAESVTGAMVYYAVVSQLGPVLTGLMLAGRVGSSIAAEIGTMKVTEQIDALRVMGTDPIAYLVVPRLLACVLLLPMLTAVGNLAGVKGAEWLCLHVWQIDPAAYQAQIEKFVGTWEVSVGLIKTLFFGATIALVACRRGLRTEGGSAGVGVACTEGVVAASILILVENFVLTVIFQEIRAVL
ncbi:MAG: MlaE family ABC transporter permease [Planctomycetota bacterium]